MGAPRYKSDQEQFLLQLAKEHGGDLEKIHAEYARKFPKPPRTAEQLRRHLVVLHDLGDASRPKQKRRPNGQLRRFTAWLQRTVQQVDVCRAAREQLMGEVRKLRVDNRALKRANDQLAGQIAKFRRLAALVEEPMKSPRVEAAKVEHSRG